MTKTLRLRRRATVAAALLSTTIAVTACGSTPAATSNTSPSSSASQTPTASTEPASQTRQFEADNGTVDIPADPQRIAALGSAPIYLSLGLEPAGLGPKAREDQLAWFPPEAQEADEAAVDLGEVDYEKVAALQPDLIVIFEPAHVWEAGDYDEKRLQSIAPTIFITLSTAEWKTQVERLADAVGQLDEFKAAEAEYDALAAQVKQENAELLKASTFIVLNRWGGDFTQESGTLSFEHPASYCTNHLEDAGLKVIPTEDEVPSNELSMENLSDFVEDADVIVYPLGPDGKVKPEFAPVTESNIWQSLPQVKEGRAIGVKCHSTLTYSSKIPLLTSLQEALGTLPAAE